LLDVVGANPKPFGDPDLTLSAQDSQAA